MKKTNYAGFEFSTTFADYRPITTAYWFYDYENLEEIKGIENLNTSEVTDMRFMFALDTSSDLRDSGKPELDLSTFNTSKVIHLNTKTISHNHRTNKALTITHTLS